MKEVNIYCVTVIEVSEDPDLVPVVRHINVAANDMREVISTLIDSEQPFCKEEDITSISFDKRVYCYKYL